MILPDKKSVIYIALDHIEGVQVRLGPKPTLKTIAQFPATLDNFQETLLSLKKSLGSKVKVLLTEDFVYVVSVAVPIEAEDQKEELEKKAQEMIPEPLSQTVWTYKKELTLKDKNVHIIQVVAAVKSRFERLSEALSKNQFEVETLLPVSLAIARLLKKDKDPKLIIYVGKPNLLILLEYELVIATEQLPLLDNINHIKTFLEFAKSKYNLIPKKIIISGSLSVDLSSLGEEGFEIQNQDLNPYLAIALIAKKDKNNILNLPLMDIKEESPAQEETKAKEHPTPSPATPIAPIAAKKSKFSLE
ncbi:hypothetical protein HY407_04915, partial [Candidatus Gottesmanbacteria bacterium]|nr:hypothetical protein [Candidatus Gottesmanbacteria bacterium]